MENARTDRDRALPGQDNPIRFQMIQARHCFGGFTGLAGRVSGWSLIIRVETGSSVDKKEYPLLSKLGTESCKIGRTLISKSIIRRQRPMVRE